MAFVNTVLQPLVNLGHNLAAQFLGEPTIHYRPLNAGPVLVNLNMIDTLNMAFDQTSVFAYAGPLTHKSMVSYAIMDLTTVHVGDYLNNFDGQVFYVVNIELLKPAMLMRCNRTVTVYRPNEYNGYGTNNDPGAIMTGWPCSVVEGNAGPKNDIGLPESLHTPATTIFIPYFEGVIIEYGDVITDELNRRFIVAAANLTSLGWQLACDFTTA